MIYLDNAATTPMSSESLKIFNQFASIDFFNPSAKYLSAIEISQKFDNAKKTILKALGGKEHSNIVFTSSATESNNLAVFGTLRKNFRKLVFSSAEHASVKNIAQELQSLGYEVEFVPLQENGEIDYKILEEVLDDRTDFISVIHVSNETGAINDLKRISEIKQKKCPKAIFHADGVQAFSKIKVNLSYFGVDLYTVSAHKMFGPKGVSALYVVGGLYIKPLIYGGGQENGIRSGTENVPAVLAFEQAVKEIGNIKENFEHACSLKKEFIDNLDCYYKLNSKDNCSPYIISLSFRGVKGETLLHMLEEQQIYISTGSACSSKKSGNSVLSAMNIEHELIEGSVRISFSKHTTKQQAKQAATALSNCYKRLLEKLS